MADDLWGDFDQAQPKPKAAAHDDVWADFDAPAKPRRVPAPLGHVTPTAPAPSLMQRVGDAITSFIAPTPAAPTLSDLVAGAPPKQQVGAIDSYTRGVMGALHRTAGTVNLLGLPVAGVVDKVHALVSGQPQTGAQDAYARTMIDPEFHAAQDYDLQPHETQGFGGKVSGAVGALLPDLVAMLGTGGESAELGAIVKPVVEQSVPRAVARGVGHAIEHSAKASLVPGVKAGVEQAQQHDATGMDALGDVLGGYAQTTATNALPLSAGARPGASLVEQLLTKGAQGAVAMPAVSSTVATLEGHPYTPEQAGVDAVLGSLMGQMGGGEHAPLGAPADAPRIEQTAPADVVAARAARAQDLLTRNADVLGMPEPAQPAAALARLDETPAAQPSPVPADAPPTPDLAEPQGQSTFAQQAAAAMRMRAQAEAARSQTTAPAVQPVADRAGSTPTAGDLTPRPFDHGELNVPLHKRGDINAQLDRYKADQARERRAKQKASSAELADQREQAKAILAGLSDERIAGFAAKLKKTPIQARKALASEAHWSPWNIIKVFGEASVRSSETANTESAPADPLTTFTQAQQALAPVKPRPRAVKTDANRKPLDLLRVLAANGGLNREAFQREGVDPKELTRRAGFHYLFRKEGGMRPHDLREFMQQEGYLPPDSEHGVATTSDHDAYDLFDRAFRGGEEIYSADQSQAVAEHRERARQADQAFEAELSADPHWRTLSDADFDASQKDAVKALAERAYDLGAKESDFVDAYFNAENDEHARNALQTLVDRLERDHAARQEPAPRIGAGRVEPSQEARPAAAFELAQPEPRAESPREVAPQGGLFAPPTRGEQVRAASEAKDASRNGLNRDLVRPEQGDGELLAGAKPAQTEVPPAGSLPPHLQRLAEKMESRGFGSSSVIDRTPDGYGPVEPTVDSVPAHPHAADRHITTEERALRNGITEAKTLLRGKMPPERRAQIERSLASNESKLDRMLATEQARELTESDLAPHEREVRERAKNASEAKAKTAALSRAQGEADAHERGFPEAIQKVLGNQADRVEYVRDYAGLPEELRNGVESRNAERNGKVQTAAIYDPASKRVFVVTSVVKTADRAVWNAAHEIAGHDGLRKLLGDKLDPALEIALQNPTVSALADAIMRDRSMAKGQRTLAAEEALAELAAAVRTGDYAHIESRYGVKVGDGIREQQSIKASIDNFVKRLTSLLNELFGRPVFLDEDVRALLDAAHEASKSEGGKPLLESTEPREAVARDDEVFAPHATDDPPVGKVADLPSRRPGESQADYARRINNTGGEELRTLQAETAKIKQIGRANFRAMLAKQARMGDVADAVFHEYRKLFDSADKTATLRSIDQWETGGTVHDADARNFFKLMDGMFADRIERLRRAKPEALKDLVENYFPHLWEDSSKATKWYQSNTKRPLDGNKSFLKQRTWGTIREGMDSGLKPVSYNPVDLALLKLQQMDKFITFHEFKNDLQSRGWLKQVKAGDKLPEGYATIDSPAFKGSHAFIIKGENGAPDEAASAHWNWAVPEPIARDVNNYLAPSLYRFGAWKSLRYVQNVLMSTRLGFSAFHAGFTTTDNLVMHVDVAGRRLLTGDIAGGLSLLVKAPLTTILSPFEGGVLNKAWRGQHVTDPHTAALLTALEEGGATRLQGTQQMDFNNALPGLIRSIRQKSVSGALKRVLPAIGEASSYLIHQKLVPAQKMAARVMLLKFELDRLAGKLGKDRGDYAGIIEAMHPDTLRQISGKVVDLVDDRLGQMNYDNQFWNKTAREVAQGLIGAVGWQVGTLRTVTGGIADLRRLWKPEALVAPLDKAGSLTGDMGRVSGRLTYLLSLGMVMGGSAALTQFLLTGQPPDEPKDYFFPKTGRKNPDGSAERLQFPSYWMDHYKLATHPLQTAGHKIHPSIGLLMEAINNQDYWGVQVRDEDAPWYAQAAQIGEHVAEGFIPYSVTGQRKLADSEASPAQRVANFVGVTTAPSTVSRSKFQAFLAEKAAASAPKGGRTQDQADHSDAMHAIEDALRRGEEPDMSALTAKERKAARKAAELPVPALRFKRLSLEDKLRAWHMATPQERVDYKLAALITGGDHQRMVALDEAIAKLPAEDQDAVRLEIQKIRGGPAAGYPDD